VDEDFTSPEREEDSVAANERTLKALLAGRPANGPPPVDAERLKAAANGGTADAPVTWVFEPESFAPLAKMVAGETYGIVTDHLGTPQGMFDGRGAEVWAADIDAYGDLRNVRGERAACPFRWPGQYEDGETGLYYNRWRYYESRIGHYLSQDPVRFLPGQRKYLYVAEPNTTLDPFGLMPWPNPSRQGHHLVPKGKANSAGLDHLGSQSQTPTFFPNPYEPGMHEAIHRAQSPHVGPLQGPWHGTPEELLDASRKGLDDVSHIRGDLKVPATGEVLARDVTPAEAFDRLKEWHLQKTGGCKG
jgi:RHS repeat-associated protein